MNNKMGNSGISAIIINNEKQMCFDVYQNKVSIWIIPQSYNNVQSTNVHMIV